MQKFRSSLATTLAVCMLGATLLLAAAPAPPPPVLVTLYSFTAQKGDGAYPYAGLVLGKNGALFGTTPEEAFYVKCDAENNPPETRDVGQLIVEIGISPVKPAEFVIFRISQFSGGAGVEE